MASIYRFREKQPVVWWHETLEKSNQECLYCGRFLGDATLPSNKEHLIGRAFGPTGAFGTGREFNFIFRACCECNAEKADVERHLSTVTLFNCPARVLDKDVDAAAVNKAGKDAHPTEGKLIRDACTEFSASARGPGFAIKFGLVAPPQAVPEYVKFLAFAHVQGLFSLVATENPTIRGTTRLLPEAHFQFFGYFGHGDWGNPQLLEIYRRAATTPRYVLIETANGFFKAVMHRTDGDRGEWFWALEWNKSVRIFGGITDRKPPLIFDGLPSLKWHQLDATTRMRADVPLQPKLDMLFAD